MSVLALLARFSYPAIFGLLVACGLGAPLSEELILLATGALVAKGLCHPAGAVAVAYAGVLAGDLLLYVLGRRLGARALSHKRVRRFCPAERRQAIAKRFDSWGSLAIFGARFVAGMRACTFFCAGVFGVRPRRFALVDAFAAAIWVPAVVLLAKEVTPLLHGPVLAAIRTVVLCAAGAALLFFGARRFALSSASVAAGRKLEDAER